MNIYHLAQMVHELSPSIQKAEYRFHVATILLFYFIENNCHNIKIAYF